MQALDRCDFTDADIHTTRTHPHTRSDRTDTNNEMSVEGLVAVGVGVGAARMRVGV